MLAAGVAHWSASCTAKREKTFMHQAHWEAAKNHELAAHAHRTAAEHNEKGELTDAEFHTKRALQYSDHAYKLAKEAHNKSTQIESL
jgi:hypothetical protein